MLLVVILYFINSGFEAILTTICCHFCTSSHQTAVLSESPDIRVRTTTQRLTLTHFPTQQPVFRIWIIWDERYKLQLLYLFFKTVASSKDRPLSSAFTGSRSNFSWRGGNVKRETKTINKTEQNFPMSRVVRAAEGQNLPMKHFTSS